MLNHFIRISFLLSILILISCSQSENTENQEIQNSEENPPPSYVPEEAIPYPAIFTDKQVPLIGGAYVLNKKVLKNTKNKTGIQLWEKSKKNFDDVKAYYLDALTENGWERKTDADKQSTPEQEKDEPPVKYFVTKFHKEIAAEKKRYVLLLNVTSGNNSETTIIKILKEM
jgi:hypothetical protein